jgi:hypothetical protein
MKSKEGSAGGVAGKTFFFGVEAFKPAPVVGPSMPAPKVPEPEPVVKTAADQPKSPDDMVAEILLKNPGMNAAALVQALKVAGISFSKVDPSEIQMKVEEKPAASAEADATSAHPAVLRDKAKESGMRDSFVSCRFLEAVANDDGIGPFRFKTVLIQEGMGNFRDRFFYTKEALQSAIAVFEGRKCYADHPSRSDETDRPERSVRDIIGHFENVHLDESDDGCATLVADLILLPDSPFEWARSLVRHAVDYGKRYPGQEFVGLSINASGDAEPVPMQSVIDDSSLPQGCKPKLAQAVEMGIEDLRMVRRISEATSVDLVTEPGAKGKIISYLEANTMARKKNPFVESKDEQKLPVMEKEAVEAVPAGEPEHADVEQDKALILDMIKKYMAGEGGEEIELDEAAASAAHEAYEAYKEMGKGHDEAMKCAADAMALAKHVAGKKEKPEAEEAVEADAKEADEEVEEKEVKESDVAKLQGRIAFLERQLKEKELAETLDKKLQESGLGRRETDVLRKLIGKPKSEAAIMEKIDTFKEGFGLGGGRGESAAKKNPFIVNTEKTGEKSKSASRVDFSLGLKK